MAVYSQKMRDFPIMGIDFFDKASKMQYDAIMHLKNGIAKLKGDLSNALKERDSLLGIVSHLHEEKAALVAKVETQESMIENLQQHALSGSLVISEDQLSSPVPDCENQSQLHISEIKETFGDGTVDEVIKVEILDEDESCGSKEEENISISSHCGKENPICSITMASSGFQVDGPGYQVSQCPADDSGPLSNYGGLQTRDSNVSCSLTPTVGSFVVAAASSASSAVEADIIGSYASPRGSHHSFSHQMEGSSSHVVTDSGSKVKDLMNGAEKVNSTSDFWVEHDPCKPKGRRPRDLTKRNHICQYCNKGFRDASDLKIHIRIHTNEKPYKCKYCNRSFAQTGHLLGHVRTHTGDRPYKCSYCGLCFARSDALRRHIRTHTGEKPHKCDTCTKSFTELRSLKDHLRLHTGEKPHTCPQCNQGFTHHASLKRHIERCYAQGVVNLT